MLACAHVPDGGNVTGGLMDVNEQVKMHKRLLFGEEKDGIGLIERMRLMEDWRKTRDKERIAIFALLVGLATGMGIQISLLGQVLAILGG